MPIQIMHNFLQLCRKKQEKTSNEGIKKETHEIPDLGSMVLRQ